MTIREAYNIYISLGLPRDKALLATAQTAFETAYFDVLTGKYKPFNSPVFKRNNNVGGIMYVGQKDSIPGDPFPKTESKTAKYAKFASLEASFKNHIRIIAKPLQLSSDPASFAKNLKLYRYYGGDEKLYSLGLNRFYNEAKTETEDTKKKT